MAWLTNIPGNYCPYKLRVQRVSSFPLGLGIVCTCNLVGVINVTMITSIPIYRQRTSRVSCILDTHGSWHTAMTHFYHYQLLPSMLYPLQFQIKHAGLIKQEVCPDAKVQSSGDYVTHFRNIWHLLYNIWNKVIMWLVHTPAGCRGCTSSWVVHIYYINSIKNYCKE